MNTAIIGLGSNIDPQENINRAQASITQKFHILAASKFITTKPIGSRTQADFLNGAILLETDLDLKPLKTALKTIETSLGRKKSPNRFDPRTIDLDILVWNDKIIDQDFYTRSFIKSAVLELMPGLKH